MQSPVNGYLFDLFHAGQLSLAGRTIYLQNPALPVPVQRADHVEWRFSEPIRVGVLGPDVKISVVRQYRDRIEFSAWPYAEFRIDFDGP